MSRTAITSNAEIYQAMLTAWQSYHKNASQDQLENAKKRITNLLGRSCNG